MYELLYDDENKKSSIDLDYDIKDFTIPYKVNEDDLIIALSTNVIAGAGLDVYEKEPLPESNKLRFLPNASFFLL